LAYRDSKSRVVLPVNPLEAPLGFRWSKLSKVLKTRQRIEREVLAARREAERAQRAIPQAMEADRQTSAELLVKGEAAPVEADKNETAARLRHYEADRELGTALKARKLVEDQLNSLIDQEAARWLAEVRKAQGEALEQMDRAGSELVAAHERVSALRLLDSYLSNPGGRWKPISLPEPAVDIGIPLPSGDPGVIPTATFVGALLEHERNGSQG
jgi:hypothetical protein